MTSIALVDKVVLDVGRAPSYKRMSHLQFKWKMEKSGLAYFGQYTVFDNLKEVGLPSEDGCVY
jgi:hypothetical protein